MLVPVEELEQACDGGWRMLWETNRAVNGLGKVAGGKRARKEIGIEVEYVEVGAVRGSIAGFDGDVRVLGVVEEPGGG